MTRTLTRGPLPARVYWFRRLLVLALALLLVVGVARLLSGNSDGSDGGDTARLADAPVSAVPSDATDPTLGPSTKAPGKGAGKGRKGAAAASASPTPPPLAAPTGPCEDSDIAVTPQVPQAVAGPGNGAVIVLDLRTVTAEACTWQVSPQTVTLKITSGRDDIWSSRECPRAVPVQDVVVRRQASTQVTLEWNAKRSNEDCSRLTDWALPGWYHVAAAALSGEPAEVQFELQAPVAATITATPEPEEKDGKGKGKGKGKERDEDRQDQPAEPDPSQPTEEPAGQPTGQPSGAVEPDQTSG